MVKRSYNLPDTEPEMNQNLLPSERNHTLQVIDVYTCEDETGQKLNLDEDTVSVRCESVGGDENGRSLLHRLMLDENNKGFFATRLFLKAIGQPHKGPGVTIDTDMWPGEQFSAFIIHNKSSNGKVYANIDTYSLDGSYDPSKIPDPKPIKNEEIAWDEGKT